MDADTLKWVTAIAVLVVIFALMLAFGNTRNREHYREGKMAGYATAKGIGCTKAYRIAESLPDCPYREGYFMGVSDYEEEKNREA